MIASTIARLLHPNNVGFVDRTESDQLHSDMATSYTTMTSAQQQNLYETLLTPLCYGQNHHVTNLSNLQKSQSAETNSLLQLF